MDFGMEKGLESPLERKGRSMMLWASTRHEQIGWLSIALALLADCHCETFWPFLDGNVRDPVGKRRALIGHASTHPI